MEIRTDSVETYEGAIASEGAALAALAETGWDEHVPTCPGWDVGTLLVHTGVAHRWGTANLDTGERVRFSALPSPPTGRDAALGWYAEGLEALASAIAATDPEKTVWTFSASGERRAAWWLRRMAQETTVHRWDASLAVEPAGTRPDPLDARLAADGIDEYLFDFLPRLPAETFAGWKGTLHIHSTDTEGEWVLDLADVTRPAVREHVKADTALRGPASDLLLWLWNRQSAEGLETHGNADVVERWQQVRI